VLIELAGILTQPLHDTEYVIILAEDWYIQERARFEASNVYRCGLKAVIFSAFMNIGDFEAVGTLPGMPGSNLESFGFGRWRDNHNQIAGRSIQKPQDSCFGYDCDLADFDYLPQELGQCFGRCQPVHDLKDLDQRFASDLARVLLVQRYGQSARPLLILMLF
jgi:hypothetical protein